LIVEDSEDDAALLVRELRRGGYSVTFERVDEPETMKAAISGKEWDVVICDYSMPKFSGLDALRLLRFSSQEVPFIFLSGTIGEETAVAALKEGAQDYLMKDNLARLIPAIQKELREAARRREHARLEGHVQQLQKFEAIGRLAGGIAHDFNNALCVIIGWAQLGYEEAGGAGLPRLQESFQTILDEGRLSAGLTAQLLAFARQQVLQPHEFNLNELVTEATGLIRTAVGEQIEFKTSLEPGLHNILADRAQMRQVLMNLCLNARDAMLGGGRLAVETKNVEIGEEFCVVHRYGRPGRYVLLLVSDTGVGMDSTTVDRIFEPFFTTKEMGRGTGLGLATVYGIIKQHEGFLNVHSELGQGTKFRVYIPASFGAPEEPSAPTIGQPVNGSETILVVEDHEPLQKLARETLESHGYQVITASNGAEAVDVYQGNSEKIDLVVLDVAMPVLNGPEAYSQMCAVRPDIRVIFTTGHTAESASLNSQIARGALFLQKPYDPQGLRSAVRSALDRKT